MGTRTSENASIVRTLFDLFLQYMYFASLTFWRNQFAVFFAPNSKSYRKWTKDQMVLTKSQDGRF